MELNLTTEITVKINASQLPIVANDQEITFRDEIDTGELVDMTFSGDGTRFIRAEISDGDPESETEPTQIKLRDAVPMLQTVKRAGDWYNPNTGRFLGFWIARS